MCLRCLLEWERCRWLGSVLLLARLLYFDKALDEFAAGETGGRIREEGAHG